MAASFQNLGADALAGDAPVDCDVLVCGDDEKAKQVASELVGKIPGARALNGGKLENARIVESLTALLIDPIAMSLDGENGTPRNTSLLSNRVTKPIAIWSMELK